MLIICFQPFLMWIDHISSPIVCSMHLMKSGCGNALLTCHYLIHFLFKGIEIWC
uniref:Uncharacterized protein n=1 Tax=Rhizophora mucronata TaxID=61149 RepID=A0A2P2NZQ5_RHIMU